MAKQFTQLHYGTNWMSARRPRNESTDRVVPNGVPATGWFGRGAGADSGIARSVGSRPGAGGFAGREGSPCANAEV